jgi:hypothetical protein
VGPVLVVGGSVLAQRVQEVRPFTMRVRSSSSARHERTHRSMIAFMRGMRMPVFTMVMSSLRRPRRSGGVSAVAVADQVLRRGAGVAEVHDQVAGQLCGPGRGGVGGGAEDADAAGGLFDGEHVQPCSGQGPGFEGVCGEDRVGLAAQERGPGLVLSAGNGIDTGILDLPDRRRGDLSNPKPTTLPHG